MNPNVRAALAVLNRLVPKSSHTHRCTKCLGVSAWKTRGRHICPHCGHKRAVYVRGTIGKEKT